MKIERIYAITFIILFALAVMPFAFAEDIAKPNFTFTISVDDQSSISDIQLAGAFKTILSVDTTRFLFSTVDATDLDNQVVLAIYNGDAILVVGENSAFEQAEYATMVQGILNDLDVTNKIILSNKPTSSNLKDLFDGNNIQGSEEPNTCKLEGEIANPSLGPVHGSACCEDLHYHSLVYNPAINGVEPTIVGAASFCYDLNQGEPKCIYDGNIEGWYYPDGSLILEYDCYNNGSSISNSRTVPTVDNNLVSSRQGHLNAYEIEVTDREMKYFQSEKGVNVGFLKLEKALVKAVEGQKIIINTIEEKYPDADTTILHEITEGKMSNLIERVKALDYSVDQDFVSIYADIKTNAKELIDLFRETSHELIPEADILALRQRVQDIETSETIALQEKVKEKTQKYNSEQVKNVLSYAGISDEKLISDIESGLANYSSIRSAVAQKIGSLNLADKKEIALKIEEAKTKSEVQKDAIMQKLIQTNWSAIKERVRAEITSSNAASIRSMQANSAQGVNN